MNRGDESLSRARTRVREELKKAAAELSSDGFPRPALDGKLLRPLAAYAMVPDEKRRSLDRRFWMGALAIEMVHEASLLHDDILDNAPERRGQPTMAAAAGVGPALVMGDHLLTAAYRAAAATGSPEFLEVFIRSVERTVAGEIAQERAQGRVLDDAEYQQIISGKSGELFRSAFTLAPSLLHIGSTGTLGELGARFGALYQMVDDFLDYCTEADRGKAPLQDYRQRKWTWPLGLIQATDFDFPESEIVARLFRRPASGGPSHMEEGAERIGNGFDLLLASLAGQGLETREIASLLSGWKALVRKAALVHSSAQGEWEGEGMALPAPPTRGSTIEWPRTALLRRELRIAAEGLETPKGRLAFFGKHAKTFRFAARLFPGNQLQRVADVYAFCRFTDDLVDEAEDESRESLKARLEVWLAMARRAYEGEDTGIPLLDGVMADMAESSVPFSYVEGLVEGIRMDLTDLRFRTLSDLRVYSYRVASVVGGWLTELFGLHDPWVLERAFALGHAMQLTNILRDVGEDLRKGRLYLPEDLMSKHGVDREFLQAKAKAGFPASSGYRKLLEELMEEAEADYDRAFEAIPYLPWFFQGPVAVAAYVYRGIHREIRRNGFDNLSLRASTSLPRKIFLAGRGLTKLRQAGAGTGSRPEGEAMAPATVGGSRGSEAVR